MVKSKAPPDAETPGGRGGGGTQHMKRVGMLVGNFDLNL